MALQVDILANDQLGPTADRIAKSLALVAQREQQISKLSNQMGLSLNQTKTAVADLEKREAARAKALETRASKDAAERKKQAQDLKKAFVEGTAIITAFTGAAAAAAAMGYAIANAAKTANDARMNSEAMIGAWTKGDGQVAIAKLDRLADALGEKFSDVREQFVKFKEAGLSNTMSAQLIKLRADLVASGLSAEQAEKEIAPVLSAKTDGARSHYIKEIARDFGVAGDGALAAYKALHSFDGALSNMDNTKTKLLEDLWKRIEPAVSDAAQQVAVFFREFAASPQGQAVIETLSGAIVDVAKSVVQLTSYWRENSTALSEGLSTAVSLGAGLVTGLMHPIDSLAESFKWLGDNIKFFGIVSINDFVAAVGDSYNFVNELASRFFEAGSNIVGGLVDGITSRASAVADAVKGMASSVTEPFKSALGIQSPSTVFAGYGRNVVEGFEQGQEEALPPAMPIQAAASQAPSGPPSQNGPSSSVSVVIEQIVIHGGDTDPMRVAALRDEIQRVLSAGLLSRGFA